MQPTGHAPLPLLSRSRRLMGHAAACIVRGGRAGMHIKISFLGAARNVTGSRYLVEARGKRLLVDCGMYQEREFRSRNWDQFQVPPASVNAIHLTHAHLDHCGFIRSTAPAPPPRSRRSSTSTPGASRRRTPRERPAATGERTARSATPSGRSIPKRTRGPPPPSSRPSSTSSRFAWATASRPPGTTRGTYSAPP